MGTAKTQPLALEEPEEPEEKEEDAVPGELAVAAAGAKRFKAALEDWVVAEDEAMKNFLQVVVAGED